MCVNRRTKASPLCAREAIFFRHCQEEPGVIKLSFDHIEYDIGMTFDSGVSMPSNCLSSPGYRHQIRIAFDFTLPRDAVQLYQLRLRFVLMTLILLGSQQNARNVIKKCAILLLWNGIFFFLLWLKNTSHHNNLYFLDSRYNVQSMFFSSSSVDC